MPLKNCHCTFSAHRWTNSSSLRLKLFLRYSRLTINRTGSRGRPAGLMPPPNSPSKVPAKSSPTRRLAGFAVCASLGATATSIEAHGSRVDNTASGCRKSIIWSSRERKKSGVLIVKSPQKSGHRNIVLRGFRMQDPRRKASVHAVYEPFAVPTM